MCFPVFAYQKPLLFKVFQNDTVNTQIVTIMIYAHLDPVPGLPHCMGTHPLSHLSQFQVHMPFQLINTVEVDSCNVLLELCQEENSQKAPNWGKGIRGTRKDLGVGLADIVDHDVGAMSGCAVMV